MKFYFILIVLTCFYLEVNCQNPYNLWIHSIQETISNQYDTTHEINAKKYLKGELDFCHSSDSNYNLPMKFFFEAFDPPFFVDTLLLIYRENEVHPEVSWIYIIKNHFIRLYQVKHGNWVLTKELKGNCASQMATMDNCLQLKQCPIKPFKKVTVGSKPLIVSKFVKGKVKTRYLVSVCETHWSCINALR